MPSITGVFYVGLTVRDLGRSAEWYQDLFGFTIARRGDEEIVFRDQATGFELGLLEHQLEAWVTRLDELRITHSGIKDLGSSALVTFRDPDKIQLEFYWPQARESL